MPMKAMRPSCNRSPINEKNPPSPKPKPWPNSMPRRPAARKPERKPPSMPPRLKKPPPNGEVRGAELARPGWVTLRCIGAPDGAVEVDGGAEYVREPRLPELMPPPTRASTVVARSPTVAITIAKVASPRKKVRNIDVLPCGRPTAGEAAQRHARKQSVAISALNGSLRRGAQVVAGDLLGMQSCKGQAQS